MPTKVMPLLLLVFSATVASAGCAHKTPERREMRGEPVAQTHAASRADWVKLGERSVDGGRDRDVIPVGGRDGRFRKIMIVVEDSALEMHDVVVHFEDGSQFSPNTRHIFAANTRSHVIDLPGTVRAIRDVEFRYGNLPGGGRAQAELWAQ